MFNIIIERGGAVYPATLSGRPWRKIGPEIEIRDRQALASWYGRGTRRFIFRPCDAGLIGIDLDAKNNRDGIREYITLTGDDPRNGYYTCTPSGGVHIYFWNTSGADYVSAEIRPGLEVKGKAFITIPGSRSDRGIYQAHGDPGTIGELPATLAAVMPIRRTDPAPMPRRTGESLALNKILEILHRQGIDPAPGARNNFSFQFSRYARKQGHAPGEVLNFLAPLADGDFSQYEIRAAVNSAYRGAR